MKSFWDYLYCVCDNSGVWEIDLQDASFRVGYDIVTGNVDVMNDGKERVLLSKCGRYLLVKGFIDFHIGNLLSEKLTNLQKSCIIMLYKHVTACRFTKEDFGFTGKLPVDYRYKDKKIEIQEDKNITTYTKYIKPKPIPHPKDCPDCWGSGLEYPQGGSPVPCRRKL